MSKRVLVYASNGQSARCSILHLSQILRDTSTIEHSVRGYILRTECVTVEFVLRTRHLEGLTCDVPVGFQPCIGKIMARGHEYPKMNSMEDIAKYIIEEESNEDRRNSMKEITYEAAVNNWKALIATAIDRAYDRMIEQTPHMTEEERINCEIIRESVKANFINKNRTEMEERFIKEHIGNYEELFEICMNGNELEFKRGIAKLLRMQNEYASRITKE